MIHLGETRVSTFATLDRRNVIENKREACKGLCGCAKNQSPLTRLITTSEMAPSGALFRLGSGAPVSSTVTVRS